MSLSVCLMMLLLLFVDVVNMCDVCKFWVLLLSTHSLASRESSDLLAFVPPASFSVQLVSSVVTPVGCVHKSRGDVVGMWVQLKR